jgi:hypothetical protein
MILIATVLPAHTHDQFENSTGSGKIARIDFLGATFMTLSILGVLLPFEIGGVSVALVFSQLRRRIW